jgi:RNA polymerase sigma-70 factor (ECF subfamily)
VARESGEALYEQHRTMVHRLCLAMLRDRTAADDAVHDTFARALRRLPEVDDPPRYLAAVARNVCRDEIARRQRERAMMVVDSLAAAAPVDAEGRAVERRVLAEAWSLLTPEERHIAVATARGYSLKEAARLAGTTAAAAAQRISRARRRLRYLAPLPLAPLMVARHIVSRGAHRVLSGALYRLRPAVDCSTTIGLAALTLAVAVTVPPSVSARGGDEPSATTGPAIQAMVPAVAEVDTVDRSAPAGARVSTPTAPLQTGRSSVGSSGPSGNSHTLPIGPLNTSDQEQASPMFESFAPSPQYTRDHTIFATASLAGCTAKVGCLRLLQSTDGGANWTALPATGFNGGAILLAPTYPRDDVMFAVDQMGPSGVAGGMTLSRSDDGGRSFVPVSTSYASLVAMNGASPIGDPQLLLAAQEGTQLLVYDGATRTTKPGPQLPPNAGGVIGLLSVPGAPDIFVATDDLATGYHLYDCALTNGCSPPIPCAANPSDYCMLESASPTFSADHLLVAGGGLLHVPDGTVTPVPTVPDGQTPYGGLLIAPVNHDRSTVVLLTTAQGMGGPIHAWASANGGSFTLLGAHGPDSTPNGLAPMSWLPDGTLIVAVPGDPTTWGVACSGDDGATWRIGC